MKVNFKWFNREATINRITSDPATGKFLAMTCAKYCDPYVPMDTGMLAQNHLIEPFKITYNQVYAHRIYNGDGFNFSKEKHPLATSHWDKPMIAARRGQISDEVSRFLKLR